ncbi:hypothetical protein AB6A40_000438 [Gnathostoma spinigerum]|uniref:Uncharacterized protein n=1 Tax=Gnathostoma spinigerum TaxID=75299 RepID=A0ABD6E8P4_9BILA
MGERFAEDSAEEFRIYCKWEIIWKKNHSECRSESINKSWLSNAPTYYVVTNANNFEYFRLMNAPPLRIANFSDVLAQMTPQWLCSRQSHVEAAQAVALPSRSCFQDEGELSTEWVLLTQL